MKKRSAVLSILVLIIALLCSCSSSVPGANTEAPSPSMSVLSSETPTGSPTVAPSQPTSGTSNDVLLTFCAMSDVHMGAKNTEEKFNRAMAYLSGMDVPPEAYLFVGDVTDTTGSTGSLAQVTQFKKIYSKYAKPTQLFYCLGPTHDVPQSASAKTNRNLFYNCLGKDYFTNDIQTEEIFTEYGIRHMKLNGFNFFSIDWDGERSGMLIPKAQNWLRTQLNEATREDPNKPIFVITHVPDVASVDAVLQRYPQVVCFTGHLHNSAAREDSITQDKKYTRIHCGGMNYYRVNGYERFNENPYLNLGDIYAFGQAMYVQVDRDNNVTITRIDVYNGVPLKEKWTIGPDRRSVYTSSRVNTVSKCMFEANDILNIQEIGTDQLKVSWDACKSGGGGSPLYYQVQLLTKKNNGTYEVVEHKELSSQQVFYPNDKGIPSLHYSYTFTDLDCLSDYAVVVTAQDCWNTSGNALVYTNGTYQSELPKGGTVNYEKRALSESEKLTGVVTPGDQKVSFEYSDRSLSPSKFTDGYSMAVRFHPTYEFKDVSIRCSSWGDTIGTLEFKLYKWNQDYATTVSGTPIDTYTLTGFQGSTVYNVFDGKYTAGEYLVVAICPNPSEGVGIYHYPLSSSSPLGYISYTNGMQMDTSIYFQWTNTATCTNPFVTYKK